MKIKGYFFFLCGLLFCPTLSAQTVIEFELPDCQKVSVEDRNDNGPAFHLYPNPARSAITVECAALRQQTVQYHIFNTVGQIVHTGEIKASPSAVKKEISVAVLDNGVYIFNLVTGEQTFNKKFIVNH